MTNTLQIREGKALDFSKSVRVFRNLNTKKGTVKYSIQQGGYVVAHASSINLVNVSFLVNLKTRDYAAKLGRKLVHAFVCGQISDFETDLDSDMKPASYLPVKGIFFLRENEAQSLQVAKSARLDKSGLKVRP